VRLGRLEVAALEYHRHHPASPPPSLKDCEYTNGVITLRDASRRVLCELVDGISTALSESMTGAVAFAVVPPFRIELRCWNCRRRFLRPSGEYDHGEVVTCRCGVGNVLPKDPLRASRED
jgi:hypothetical protein